MKDKETILKRMSDAKNKLRLMKDRVTQRREEIRLRICSERQNV